MITKKKGIDLSVWNGTIDFRKVKEDGIEFVILRSSFRHTVDSRFFEYVKGCQENGIQILGVYHFSYAYNVAQATSEAKFCTDLIEKAGLSKDTIVFFDFEYDTIKKAMEAGVLLNQSSCIAHSRAFCEYAEKAGYIAGIYTNLDYYVNMYTKDLIEKYILWLADYSGDPDYTCMIQQYSSKGRVDGITGDVDLNYCYIREDESPKKFYDRTEVVKLAESWLGKNETDGSYKEIIDIYNSYAGPFPRGVKMEYEWAWCACTWSALAIKLGYTDIMPIEVSVGYLIEEAKKLDCWVEDDFYIPLPGDAICYDWDDDGVGDNVGWPEHIGIVEYVDIDAGYMTVIEGNYDCCVKKRTIAIDGKYIRGFITPNYSNGDSLELAAGKREKDLPIDTIAHEVISGLWGNGESRRLLLESYGYSYAEVQDKVNEILNPCNVASDANQDRPSDTKVYAKIKADSFNKNLAGTYKVAPDIGLYLRTGPGTNKKALCCIPKGTMVKCFGYYSVFSATKWLYVRVVLNGIEYCGFCSSVYLVKK